eukprot:176783-Ditylum_brightwellii.AAC.1
MMKVKPRLEMMVVVVGSFLGGCCQVLGIVGHAGIFRARLFTGCGKEGVVGDHEGGDVAGEVLDLSLDVGEESIRAPVANKHDCVHWHISYDIFANDSDSHLNGADDLGPYDTSGLVDSADDVVNYHSWVEGGNGFEVGDDVRPVVDWVKEGWLFQKWALQVVMVFILWGAETLQYLQDLIVKKMLLAMRLAMQQSMWEAAWVRQWQWTFDGRVTCSLVGGSAFVYPWPWWAMLVCTLLEESRKESG